MTKRLTPAQRRALEIGVRDPLGLIRYYDRGGYAARSRQKLFDRLRGAGLVSLYVHGGYEITPAGREAYDRNAYVAPRGDGERAAQTSTKEG